ncbi:MAG: hypothetical protein ACD_79C00675G0001 [uncultured bacterium]|nr:MAG: hypothetical protein ACD_79C00675G0001 [uncultured bacterium]
MNTVSKKNVSEVTYAGIPVSEGVIIGKIFKINSGPKPIVKYAIETGKVQEEVTRFENAILETRRQIIEIQEKINQAMGKEHASIFNAHLLLIEDFTIIKEVIKKIQSEKFNAEHVFSQVMERFIKVFSDMQDEYLKERVSDIKDVTRRVVKNLVGESYQTFPQQHEEDVIILAYDLSPSETTLMHKDFVVGLATDIGGKTSHTAIMARTLGIPAVVGLHDVSSRVPSDANVILDGTRGLLIVNPTEKTLKKYFDTKTILENYEHQLDNLKGLESVTQDGRAINLLSNIEVPEDLDHVFEKGSSGIGLYRTEYYYMNRTDLPSEADLTEIYTNIVKRMKDSSIIIRTIDLGGDKFLCHMQLPEEMNPFLGWRAIRFCLERVDIFKTQLRAILRASVHAKTKIMFPMISNVTEVIQAKNILNKCKKELKSEGIAFDENIQVGVMIEIPSAAVIADLLADHVDFFSIGTNDLIQYTLAVDRINEKIAYLYQPLHPAVIRLIQNVVNVGMRKNIEVSLCGEMAADPIAVILLLGLGITNLSLSPFLIPRVKNIIRSVKYSHMQDLVQKVSVCSTAEEVRAILHPVIKAILPSFIDI